MSDPLVVALWVILGAWGASSIAYVVMVLWLGWQQRRWFRRAKRAARQIDDLNTVWESS